MRARSRFLIFAVGILAVGLMAVPANADVIYTFSTTGIGGQTIGFQYTSASFLSSPTLLLGSQLANCPGCSGSPILALLAPSGLTSALTFTGTTGGGIYLFPASAFGAVGTYWTGLFSNATLVVTSVAEPSTILFAFLSLAMVLGFAVLGRKRGWQMGRS